MAKIPLLLGVCVEMQACSCCRTELGDLVRKRKALAKRRMMPAFLISAFKDSKAWETFGVVLSFCF